MISHRDRISGGLVGLLVGDALGVPYEFYPASAIPPADEIGFAPPPGFARAHAGVPVGTWSDDGAQALCLLTSLLDRGRLDPHDLAGRLVNWYEHGYMAVDGDVFDVGIQTSYAIRRLRAGTPPLDAGGSEAQSQGNGSLMRVLPLALWHRGSDLDLIRDAQDQSRLTHGHVTVQACCALYCLWARRHIEAVANPWAAAVAALRAAYRDSPVFQAALETDIRPEAEHVAGGSGFVVDCLFSAKQALAAGPYEAVVKAAIAFGQDTDTTACVAGGIAGIRDGLGAIPLRWREGLRGADILAPLLEKVGG